MSAVRAKQSAQLGRLMSIVLEPLPAEEVFDGEYNRLQRKVRVPAWRRAMLSARYAEHRRWAASYRQCVIDAGGADPEPGAPRLDSDAAWDAHRKAVAAMILTPAPRPEDLQWKRRQAEWTAIPLPRAEIDAALAVDEAFFAAHPVKRELRRASGSTSAEGRS